MLNTLKMAPRFPDLTSLLSGLDGRDQWLKSFSGVISPADSEELFDSVAVTPAHVRVPTQRTLVPSFMSVVT